MTSKNLNTDYSQLAALGKLWSSQRENPKAEVKTETPPAHSQVDTVQLDSSIRECAHLNIDRAQLAAWGARR